MASSSANPLASELTAEEIAAQDAEAVVKYDEGVALIKENRIDDAVQLFYELLETRTALHGELALEVAPIYFKYGSCLFYKAQDEADILGAQAQSAATKRDNGSDAVEGGSATKDEKIASEEVTEAKDTDNAASVPAKAELPEADKGKGKAPMPEQEGDEEAPGAADAAPEADEDDEDEAPEEEEEKTDMELAWENLETARHIYETHLDSMTSDQKLMLAEVYERLADLSMEKEDFETCVADFKQALAIFQALLPANDRREAALHFKMALALQFNEEPEDGLAHCQQALVMMESKLDELKSLVPEGEGDSEAAAGTTKDIQGVLEDLRDKEVELKEVIAQNNSTKEAIKNAFAQFTGGLGGLGGTATAPAAVQDLGVIGGSSGRTRVTPAPVPAAPKAEAENKENDAANNATMAATAGEPQSKAKKRTLEDLMAARARRSKAMGRLYSAMQSVESKLGGGEGVEGLYGSITRTGTQEILDCLALHTHFCEDSVLVDIGAGLARPLLHAAVSHGVRNSFGIELDQVKCDKAHAFVDRCLAAVSSDLDKSDTAWEAPCVLCAPVEAVATLTPATHAYTFWEGVCADARCALGGLFAASETLGAISCIQRTVRQDPVEMLKGYDFGPVKLAGTCNVAMSGSGRRFTAYTFIKEGWTPPYLANPGWVATISPLNHEGRITPPAAPAVEKHAVVPVVPEIHVKVNCKDVPAKEMPAPKPQGLLTSAFRATKSRQASSKAQSKPEDNSAPIRSRSGRIINPARRP